LIRYIILAQQSPDAGGGFLGTIILFVLIFVIFFVIIRLKQKAVLSKLWNARNWSIAVLVTGFVIWIVGYMLGAQGESKIRSWNFQREAEGIEMIQTSGHIKTAGIIVAIAGGLWLVIPLLQARQKDDSKEVNE
jgi:multisubunit Na+/H+ antiporter MnhB subunit